jgi:hypothetical protein
MGIIRLARAALHGVGLPLTLAVACGTPAAQLAAQGGSGFDRGSFTLMLDVGLGLQHDGYIGQTQQGVAGLNLGIGGFLTDKTALMFRLAGTTASYGHFQQSSGVMAPTLQYWIDDRLYVDGGVGIGFGGVYDSTDGGLGFILGAGYAVLNRGKHNLQIAIEYTPAFTEPEAVHSLGVTVGWQLL